MNTKLNTDTDLHNSKKIINKPKYSQSLLNNPKGSSQDFLDSGYSQKGYLYGIVADGHGKNRMIDFIRNIDFSKIVDLRNFNDIFMELITSEITENDSKGTGSTFSLVLIRETDILVFWLGDSLIRIYHEDGRLYYQSDPNRINPKDEHKIMELVSETIHNSNINIIDINYDNDDTIGSIDMSSSTTRYTYPKENNKVVPFSLGHGHHFNNFVVESIRKPDGYKIIIGSDGLWDMITNSTKDHSLLYEQSAEDIAKEAERRWHGKWKYKHGENTIKTSFPKDNIDDIAVVTMQENSSSKRKDISIPGGIEQEKLKLCSSEIKVEEEEDKGFNC